MRMSKFERKSEEPMEWLINVIGIESGINMQTCKHLRRYKEREVLVDERWQ